MRNVLLKTAGVIRLSWRRNSVAHWSTETNFAHADNAVSVCIDMFVVNIVQNLFIPHSLPSSGVLR